MLLLLSLLVAVLNSQVPPFDKCQAIGQKEPPECPEHIGIPCPACIINTYADYKTGYDLSIPLSMKNSMSFYMNTYLNYWLTNYPPSLEYPLDQPRTTSVADGSSGRALIFFRMYYYTNNRTYLNIATEYLNNSLTYLDTNNHQFSSYMFGLNGVYTTAIQIYYTLNNTDKVNEYINKVNDLYNDICIGIHQNMQYSPKYNYSLHYGGFFTGISGFFYNGILLNMLMDNITIINHECMSNLGYYLIKLGIQQRAKYNTPYMIYETGFVPNCYLVGSGDGVGGVLRQIFLGYLTGYLPELNTYYSDIKITLDSLVTMQYSDGNMPTWFNITDACAIAFAEDGRAANNDARVQWCHGAPGFIDTFSLASIVFNKLDNNNNNNSEIYLLSALKAYNSTWNRGLLIKGLMQCHGIGGNTYELLHMYKNIQLLMDNEYLMN
eukprot:475178_1